MRYLFTLKGLDGLDWDVALEVHEGEVGITCTHLGNGERISMDTPMMDPEQARQLAIALIEGAASAEVQIAAEVHES
jgi:hypothetical protein